MTGERTGNGSTAADESAGAQPRCARRERSQRREAEARPRTREHGANGRERGRDERDYDLIVFDAPATGHALAMLRSPHTFGTIARVGPVARQAGQVRELLEDPARTAYLAVTQATEMGVTETLELREGLRRELGRELDAVIVNGTLPRRFEGEELRRIAALGGVPPPAGDTGRNGAGEPTMRDPLRRACRARRARAEPHATAPDRPPTSRRQAARAPTDREGAVPVPLRARPRGDSAHRRSPGARPVRIVVREHARLQARSAAEMRLAAASTAGPRALRRSSSV